MTRTRVLALLAALAALVGALVLLVPTPEQRAADAQASQRASRDKVQHELVPPSGTAAPSPSEELAEVEVDVPSSPANEPALTFFVSERNGSPVGTAVVVPHPRFTVNAFTDATGWGAFEELPAGVVELAVSAPGFLETVVARPEGNRTTVVLDRVTELVVRLAVPPGRTPREYGVRLEACLLIQGERSWREHATERPDAQDGEATFRAVPPGDPLRLFIVDVLGALGEEHPVEPLGAGETRVLDVVLADPGRFLHGRVVDPSDGAVEDARIVAVVASGHSVLWKDHPTVTHTDGGGNFLVGPAFGSTVDLVIRSSDFAPLPAPKLALADSSAAPLPFRLMPGKSVLVSAESADGDPIAIEDLAPYETASGGADVRVFQDGLDLGLWVHSIDGRLAQIRDVPIAGAKIVLRYGGKRLEHAVGDDVDEVHFRLP